MEAIHRDYAPKGVQFFYVYKALAHPELRGYVAPYTLAERLAHVREAKQKLRTRIPWIVDAMDNRIKHAFGDRPNSEFVVDPQGIVLRKRAWSDPVALRKDLEELVGPVEQPTDPASLNLGRLAAQHIARPPEIAPLALPDRLVPVRVRPNLAASAEPFYAKLRVEVERSVLEEGSGQIYLGLRLDPLYDVHWNNLVGPVRITLAPPTGLSLERTELVAPQPAQESDAAPREFLVAVRGAKPGMRLGVTVSYAACHDEEGWCKVLTQGYVIELERDRDAGRVMRRGGQPRRRRADEARSNGTLVRGTVAAIHAPWLTLRTGDGDTIKLRVLPGTYVLRRGKRLRVGALQVGQRVAVRIVTGRAQRYARYVLVLPASQ